MVKEKAKYEALLTPYISLVDFLGSCLGPNYEISLYDLSQSPNELIAIANGHLSGRQVGAGLTDLHLKMLADKLYEKHDYILNSKGLAKGGEILRSSTKFIKNEKGIPVGLFCVSHNVSKYEKLSKDILNLCNMGVEVNEFEDFQFPASGHSDWVETYPSTVAEISNAVINQATEALGIPVERLEYSEKLSIVEDLNKRGVFLVKGAVADVAQLMKISEATMYRYIKQIHDK